jgi:hypothetical protein
VACTILEIQSSLSGAAPVTTRRRLRTDSDVAGEPGPTFAMRVDSKDWGAPLGYDAIPASSGFYRLFFKARGVGLAMWLIRSMFASGDEWSRIL